MAINHRVQQLPQSPKSSVSLMGRNAWTFTVSVCYCYYYTVFLMSLANEVYVLPL